MSLEQASEAAEIFQKDPVLHLKEIQGVESLHAYQQDKILLPILHNDRVAIRACHDVGKTFTLAKVVLWLGSCFPGSKIITTAPSWLQVEKLLWSEIRSGHRKSKIPLGGRMLTTEWKIADDWFSIGISPKDDGQGDGSQGTTSNFQGFHAPLVVVIFDEATGVSPKRWIQAEGMMTSHHVKFIAIGNPTSKASPFYQCFKDPAWYKSHISCFDSPNMIANGFTCIDDVNREVAYLRTLSDAESRTHIAKYECPFPYLLTAKWVIELARKRGVDHPLFQGKALGEFPDEDDHVVIPLSVVETSQRREYEPIETDSRYIGVDVARFGSDETIITRIEGWKVVEKRVVSKRDTTEVTGEVVRMLKDLPRRREEVVCVDGTGIGAGVVDQLKERTEDGTLPPMITIVEVNNGEGFDKEFDEQKKQDLKSHFVNKKAWMFDLLSKDMKEHLVIPPDMIYQEELPGIRYSYDSRGRMEIESKDKFKARTGLGSPDTADSLALANFGRHVSGQIGSFTEMVKKSHQTRRPIASGLRSGDQW